MTNYVRLDNLPDTPNHLLNILWDRNCEMTLAELTEAVNEDFSKHWKKKEVQQFIRLLIRLDYVTMRRQGLKAYYSALGSDYKL